MIGFRVAGCGHASGRRAVRLADLGEVRLDELPGLAGHPVLEAALARLRRDAALPRDPTSGFQSAI